MNKKSIPKLSKIFTAKLIHRSKVILLGIIIVSLFLPVSGSLSLNIVRSQGAGDNGVRGPGGVQPKPVPITNTAPTNPDLENCFTQLKNIYGGNSLNVFPNRYEFGLDQEFNLFASIKSKKDIPLACSNFFNNDSFVFTYFLTQFNSISRCTNIGYNPPVAFRAFPFTDTEAGWVGFQNLSTGFTINKLFQRNTTSGYTGDYCLDVYFHPKSQDYTNGIRFQNSQYVKVINGSSNKPMDDNFPDLALAKSYTTPWGQAVLNNTESRSTMGLKIDFIRKDDKGLRDKYRLTKDDEDMVFGGKPDSGPDGLTIFWGKESSTQLRPGQSIKETKESQSGDLTYRWSNIAFAYEKTWKPDSACQVGLFSNQKCALLFYNEGGAGDKGNFDEDAKTNPAKILGADPVTINPILKKPAWSTELPSNAKADTTGKLGEVSFVALATLYANSVIPGKFGLYIMGETPPKFTVEVYENITQIVDLCKKENASSPDVCTEDYARYKVGKVIEQTAGSSTKDTNQGLADKLFEFLAKIIAYIVLLLTSIIYWVFSVFLVPILVALIQVHPYKDEFVNFVYPGWIIIRNLTNIAFIVALLYMGLKILFQQEDASKSRGFIVTLILMALLVNFSLVIAQSIVAIADTVQSQFLPENSNVIEALGHKLMLDPIIVFRGGDDSKLSFGEMKAEGYASDLPKAIVLLILAIAAFFSFVALIAFMFVRLVALWVLYMLSPLAYVGRILPETRKYADQWWQEFIKYSFSVPIMAFFLNIAALMAVTFSKQSGDQVQVQGAPGFWGMANASGVEFALTTISHFIVLLFLFAGMKYALQFGGAGAEKIVGAAKNGFDFMSKTVPKYAGTWAKDNAGEMLANRYKEKSPRLAAGISAITQPILTGKKFAKRFWAEPKQAQMERLENIRKPLDEYSKRAGLNKIQAMKMLGWKLAGKSAKRVQGKSSAYSEVMTNEERDQARQQMVAQGTGLEDLRGQITRALGDAPGQITMSQAEIYQEELDKKIKDLEKKEAKDLAELEVKRAKAAARGDSEEVERIQNQTDAIRAQNNPERTRLKNLKDDVDQELKAHAGEAPDARVRVMNKKDALTLNAEHVNAKINDLEKSINEDDALRGKLGINRWDDYDRASVTKGLESIIRNRQFPETDKQRIERLSDESEQAKKYNEIDDPDTLQEVFKNAMKNNNLLLATAIGKKLFKMGFSKDVLSEHGFKNNIDGLKKFIGEKWKNAPAIVRSQIANELSNSAAEGGNRALYKAMGMDAKGVLNWNSKAEQFEKLAKTAGKKSVAEKKMNEMFYEDENGANQFLPGEIEEIQKVGPNTQKRTQIRRTMPSLVAAEILKQHAAGRITLDPNTRDAIQDASGRVGRGNR